MSDQQITIGERAGWGMTQRFGISQVDRRQHVVVLGKTGSGKTTLLRNLFIQHVIAGHAVGLIDPHGDLAEELLNHIPPSRAHHLCYFNPGDLDYPIGMNPLSCTHTSADLTASGIVSAFKGLWRDSWGPRMEYILFAAVMTLLECPNMTLLGLNQLLSNDTYRAWVLGQISDPFLLYFWTREYAEYDLRFRREAIAPIQNKTGRFLQSPIIRNILGQVRNRVDFPFMMDNNRIFIANLSKGKLGEDKSNLLGSLLTTQFQLAAMARAGRPEGERRDHHLIIDEFQNFTTDMFTSILSEARKFHFSLTLCSQFIEQTSLPVRQAIFGNVGTLISFRVGYSDAEVLEKEFGHAFPASTFTNLDQYEAVVKLLEQGTNREPFIAKSLPPLENRVGRKEKLIRFSRERFATPRNLVEAKLNTWMAARERDGFDYSKN